MVKQTLISWARGRGKKAVFARVVLVFKFSRSGIWFYRQGDELLWLFPWKRQKYNGRKYISLNFSGSGEFGDAAFFSLKEIDKAWNDFHATCQKINEREKENPTPHPF